MEVEWKAFELRPEEAELPEKSPEYLARAKAGVEALSKQYGLEMKWNRKSKHSRMALAGGKYAAEHGMANDYHEAVFRAQYQQEININDLSNLVEIADHLGFNKDEFREAVTSEHYQSLVLQDHAEAQNKGITGIPCFIFKNQGVMGAQSYESLVKLIKEEY